jgi:hypothetical protein
MTPVTFRPNVQPTTLASPPQGQLPVDKDRLFLDGIDKNPMDLEPLKSLLEKEGITALRDLPEDDEKRAQSLKRLNEIANAIYERLVGKGKMASMMKVQAELPGLLEPTLTPDMIHLGLCHVGVAYNEVHEAAPSAAGVKLALITAADMLGVELDGTT